MRWLRSTWRLRLLVGLLTASLLPFMVVMPEQQGLTATQSQADWLRSQVRVSLDAEAQEAVDGALDAAEAAEARTLDAFIRAFADAYAQQSAEPSLGDLFDAPDLRGERLVRYLQQRVAHVSGVAVFPRIGSAVQAATSGPSPDRLMTVGSTVPSAWSRVLTSAWTTVRSDAWTVVVPVRMLFTAQPMGP